MVKYCGVRVVVRNNLQTSSNDIKVDSISYDQKTGDFGFDTTTGKHFEFTDACHGYATHNGKIIGNAQTGHYFVKESKSKADAQKKD